MIYVYNIEWDTDGEEVPYLPRDVEIANEFPWTEDEVLDHLADNYGWTVLSAEIDLNGGEYPEGFFMPGNRMHVY